MITSLKERVKLNNGTEIPGLGLGVFQIPDEMTAEVVRKGIVNGYRLIDTAQIYKNEEGTGIGIEEGLKETGLKREDLFVTSKIWNAGLNKEQALKSFEESLKKLKLDYLDLFLIHWPGKESFKESWTALEELYKAGKIKAIGVSNFEVHHLKELMEYAEILPVINQVELHPKLSQKEIREFASKYDIKVQAWSPLMQGKLLSNPVIKKIAESHSKSTAQVILRWHLQNDILIVVKSVHDERMKSNADIFDFTLNKEEMELIDGLNEDLRNGPHPDEFDFK